MIKSLVTGIVLVYIRNSVSILLVVHPSQVVLEVKNLPTNAERFRFDPWVGKIPWSMKWQHTPVFLSGKSHGQKSPVG